VQIQRHVPYGIVTLEEMLIVANVFMERYPEDLNNIVSIIQHPI